MPESALHLPPGTVLQEKYLIGRALGQGGFGITYLAWDMNLNLKLAIKEYLPQELAYRTGGQSEVSIYKKSLADNFNYGLEKFLEEARTLARFNEYPNIISVRDYFKANGTAYLVMNHIEGVTLKEYLESRKEPLPFEQALNIFMPVLDALKEVHSAGILHRDISPDNLLIDAKGRVVLIDFGAARQAMGEQSRSISMIMKAGYSPIEQYQSKGKQGPWTDIYAVTASFYRAIIGEVPPDALDRIENDTLILPTELGIDIEKNQELAIEKALSLQAKDRYQTIEELQYAFLDLNAIDENVAYDKTGKCLFCNEEISATAIKCEHCQSDLELTTSSSDVEEQSLQKNNEQKLPKKNNYTLLIIGLLIIVSIGIYAFDQSKNDRIDLAEDEEVATSDQSISAGGYHTLFLTVDREVFSFGSDKYGQVGLGEVEDNSKPSKITHLPNIEAISAGYKQSLLLSDEGEVYSFGYGSNGQLGHGEARSQSEPKKIDGLLNVEAISAGGFHSLALLKTGEVYSFGFGDHGRLGHGDVKMQLNPLRIDNLNNIAAISAGYQHSMVLSKNAEVYSFGFGESGCLGHGNTRSKTEPTIIEGLTSVKAISAGGFHSLILMESGEVYSFGFGGSGRLGHGDANRRLEPTRIEEFNSVKAISAGWRHSLLLLEDGTVYSFGWNEHGQLGHNDNVDRRVPTKIEGLSGVKGISAGSRHSLVLLESGENFSFGYGRDGRLGYGGNEDQLKPTIVERY